jgi:hypothetical protein
VQTNCLTSNSLTRNVGEVLGVFGDSETYQDSSGRWRVRSTAKAFATYCQRCHAQPYLDKFSAQWDAAGENWRGTNAPSDLTDHFVAEDYLGQIRQAQGGPAHPRESVAQA